MKETLKYFLNHWWKIFKSAFECNEEFVFVCKYAHSIFSTDDVISKELGFSLDEKLNNIP